MQTPSDPKLRGETAAYALRYRCEHCAHFDPEALGCAEGFPNAVHRDQDVQTSTTIEFCKAFELC